MNLFLTEHKKLKGKHILLTMVLFIGIGILWYLGTVKEKTLPYGWKNQIYSVTILNAIVFPTFLAVLANKLIDLEHKGCTWKLLEVMLSKKEIYWGKVLYGTVIIVAFILMQTLLLFGIGNLYQFTDSFDLWAYGLFFISNFFVCMIIFFLQLNLSLFFQNQAVAIAVGLLGSLCGIFLFFLPRNLFHYILPWGQFVLIMFVKMGWNEATHDIKLYYEFQDFTCIISIVAWLLLLSIVGYVVYLKKEDIDAWRETRNIAGRRKTSETEITFSKLPTELMKIKKTPIWIAYILLPLISSLIGSFNYIMNVDILKLEWYDLWSQHSLFFGIFFLSPLLGVYASYLWHLEHTGTNWNLIMTLVSPYKIVFDKIMITSFMGCISLVWIGILFGLSGTILGLDWSHFPPEFGSWILCGMVGCIAVSTVQSYLSMIIRSFSVPIGIALCGGILGLAAISQNKFYLTPYSILAVGLRSNNPCMALPVKAFIVGCIFFTVIFYLFSVLHLYLSDVKTQEV